MAGHRTCPRDASNLQGQVIGPGGCWSVCPTCHGMWLHKVDLVHESNIRYHLVELIRKYLDLD